jgi:hypothetical protein
MSQGEELQQVVLTTEHHLEGPLKDTVIQESTEQEAIAKHLKAFEVELLKLE